MYFHLFDFFVLQSVCLMSWIIGLGVFLLDSIAASACLCQTWISYEAE
jgi:hypothetical protein